MDAGRRSRARGKPAGTQLVPGPYPAGAALVILAALGGLVVIGSGIAAAMVCSHWVTQAWQVAAKGHP